MAKTQTDLQRDFLLYRSLVPIVHLGDVKAPLERGVIAIGVFDGMHAGHRELLARTVADAHERGCAAYAVTFDPDPDEVVSPHPARHLLATADRLASIAASGVDAVVVVPFTPQLAALDHARFFSEVLFPRCPACAIHVGSDFRLGAGGASTVPIIRAWCTALGIDVVGHDLLSDDGAPISATRIRAALAAGDLESAERELGRSYMVRGVVRNGRGQGTGMGFPTANIEVDTAMQMPAEGVYAGFALVGDVAYPAAINVGVPPTFRDRAASASLEANLIGYAGDLYGRPIALSFVEFLRPSRVFPSTDELIATVLGNIDYIRKRYGGCGVTVPDDIR